MKLYLDISKIVSTFAFIIMITIKNNTWWWYNLRQTS